MDAALVFLAMVLMAVGAGVLLLYIQPWAPVWVQLLIAVAVIGVLVIVVSALGPTGSSLFPEVADEISRG